MIRVADWIPYLCALTKNHVVDSPTHEVLIDITEARSMALGTLEGARMGCSVVVWSAVVASVAGSAPRVIP
jgi:hypothetical protein